MKRIIVAAIAALVTLSLFAASAGSLRGRVLGPDEKPMAGVVVVLRNDVTGFKQQSPTGSNGEFSFYNIPFNSFLLFNSVLILILISFKISRVHFRCSLD